MTLKTTLVALLAAFAAISFPAAAAAEYLVPPDNSAVNQYTESLPTSGGSRDSGQREGQSSSPTKALGKRNAHRLEREGEDGRAVAAFAAATDPGEEAGAADPETEDAAGAAGRGTDGTDSSGRSGAGGSGERRTTAAGTTVDRPDGSSRFAEVLGEATGASSAGQLGLWLPLILLATAAWAVGYALRQRQQTG